LREGVSDRLGELLGDRVLARAMGERGRDRAVQQWTWQRSGDRLRELLG